MSNPKKSKKPFISAYHLGEGAIEAQQIKDFISQAISEVGDLENLSIKAKIADVRNGKFGKVLIVM
jgi:hypothetical protein